MHHKPIRDRRTQDLPLQGGLVDFQYETHVILKFGQFLKFLFHCFRGRNPKDVDTIKGSSYSKQSLQSRRDDMFIETRSLPPFSPVGAACEQGGFGIYRQRVSPAAEVCYGFSMSSASVQTRGKIGKSLKTQHERDKICPNFSTL